MLDFKVQTKAWQTVSCNVKQTKQKQRQNATGAAKAPHSVPTEERSFTTPFLLKYKWFMQISTNPFFAVL